MLFVFQNSSINWTNGVEHDFETLKQSVKVKHTFVYKNNSDKPLAIETVRTTCGCTAVDWDETPVLSGQSGEIKIEFDAFRKGEFSKVIKVFFYKVKKPELLYIYGVVE